MKNFLLFLLLGAVLPFCMSGAANATLISFPTVINGAQANAGAGTGSPGTGFADVTLNTSTNLLSWDIMWSGLIGTETVMHFHGPALPNQNAGVQVDFGGISGIVSPSIGSTIINTSQSADLLAGLWYINIHTTAFLAGEIRGQLIPENPVPEPATMLLLGTGLVGMAGAARRRKKNQV